MIILACEMIREELEISIRDLGLDVTPVYLEAALHVDLNNLRDTVRDKLDELRASSGEEIKLLYGNMCHPDLCKICAERLVGLPSKGINCIELVIPPELIKKLDSEAKTFYITSMWLAQYKNFFGKQGWDQIDVRMNMGYYDRILLLDAGIREITDEEIIEYFELVQVPIDTYPITLDYFKERLLALVEGRA